MRVWGLGNKSAYGHTMEPVGFNSSTCTRWLIIWVCRCACRWNGRVCGRNRYWWVSPPSRGLLRHGGLEGYRRQTSLRWDYAAGANAGYSRPYNTIGYRCGAYVSGYGWLRRLGDRPGAGKWNSHVCRTGKRCGGSAAR